MMIILVDKDGKKALTTLIETAMGAGVFKSLLHVSSLVGCIKDIPPQALVKPEENKPVEDEPKSAEGEK